MKFCTVCGGKLIKTVGDGSPFMFLKDLPLHSAKTGRPVTVMACQSGICGHTNVSHEIFTEPLKGIGKWLSILAGIGEGGQEKCRKCSHYFSSGMDT